MTKLVGVIAEDQSDVEVINEIIAKIATNSYGVKRFVGHGCGKLRAKARMWAENLYQRGCRLLIVVHDLDTSSLNALREQILAAVTPCPIPIYLVVIPIRELEAWLLADHQAIRAAFKIKASVPMIRNPEALIRPKEHLRNLVEQRLGKGSYVNTIHNKRIAEKSSVINLRRCTSFRPLECFLIKHLRKGA